MCARAFFFGAVLSFPSSLTAWRRLRADCRRRWQLALKVTAVLHQEAIDQREWAAQPEAALGVVPAAHEAMSRSPAAAATCSVTPHGGAVRMVKRKSAEATQGWVSHVVDCGRLECGCLKPQAEGLLCTEMLAACQCEGLSFETVMGQADPGHAAWHKLQSPALFEAMCKAAPSPPSLGELRMRRDSADYRAELAAEAEERGLKVVLPPPKRVRDAHGNSLMKRKEAGAGGGAPKKRRANTRSFVRSTAASADAKKAKSIRMCKTCKAAGRVTDERGPHNHRSATCPCAVGWGTIVISSDSSDSSDGDRVE